MPIDVDPDGPATPPRQTTRVRCTGRAGRVPEARLPPETTAKNPEVDWPDRHRLLAGSHGLTLEYRPAVPPSGAEARRGDRPPAATMVASLDDSTLPQNKDEIGASDDRQPVADQTPCARPPLHPLRLGIEGAPSSKMRMGRSGRPVAEGDALALATAECPFRVPPRQWQ